VYLPNGRIGLYCFVTASILVAGLFCPAGWGQTGAEAGKRKAEDETCTVSGIVVRSLDGGALKSATVQLTTESDRDHHIAAKTTADGHFQLKNVPPGQYKMIVTRNGFVTREYGQKKAGGPGATLTLRPGQKLTDLVFKLARAGVITGKVFDGDGEPVSNVSIEAMRQVYKDGRKNFETTYSAQTNDLGEYRIFGLGPGRYVIAAELPSWEHVLMDREYSGAEKGEGEKSYAKIFYPSALDAASASSVVVKEGEEIPSIDILMREVSAYRVRGKVEVLFPHKEGTMQLMVVGRGQRGGSFGTQELVKADGTFEIPELVPGEYTLIAFFFDQGKVTLAEEDVDVVNQDIDHLTLQITPGTEVPGQLIWDGKPSLAGEKAYVFAFPTGSAFGGQGGIGYLEENNQFVLKEMHPGRFQVNVVGVSKDCYIQQVKLGETVLPDHVLHMKRGMTGPLEVTVSAKGARVEGVVSNDETLSVAGVWVVAVPEENKREMRFLFKGVTTDQYGHYELRGLAPGKYTIFAWDGVEEGEWEDPDFLKANAAKGVAIEVRDGDKKTTDLQLIPLETKASQVE